jgi:hypoxia up-regulated 1
VYLFYLSFNLSVYLFFFLSISVSLYVSFPFSCCSNLMCLCCSESLDQNLNGDEAGAFGAVFHAADLHPAFRVRQMPLTEIASLPVGMRFSELEESAEEGAKGFAKRVSLLRRNSAQGKKISVAFSHDRDLQCSAFYDAADLPMSTSANLGLYHITGLSKIATDKAALLTSTGQGKPKVSVSFQMSSSGVLELLGAEATIEESKKEPKPKPAPKPKENATDVNATESSEKPAADEAAKEETKAEPVAEVTEWVWRNKTHRFALTVTGGLENSDLRPMNAEEKTASLLVYVFECTIKSSIVVLFLSFVVYGDFSLKNMAAVDAARRALADARNALESFIYGTREKLTADDVIDVTSQAQRDELTSGLDVASSWLSEHGLFFVWLC